MTSIVVGIACVPLVATLLGRIASGVASRIRTRTGQQSSRIEVLTSRLASVARKDGTVRWPLGGELERSPGSDALEIWYSHVADKYVVATRSRTSFVSDARLEKEIGMRLDHVRQSVGQDSVQS